MSQSIGGGRYEVRAPQRETRVGTWHLLSDQDGHPRGGLRLNALNEAESQRLDAAIAVSVTGLLPVVEQLSDNGDRWLITAFPAAPTLAQVIGARMPLPEAVALLIAVDTGQTLAALHEADLAHGALVPESIVLSGDGRALIAEAGYAHALAGTTAGPGHDVSAWVKLLRDLSAPRATDRARQLLTEAADRAEAMGGSAGLTVALGGLVDQATQTAGYGERSALAVLAALVPAPQQVQPVSGLSEEALTVPTPNGIGSLVTVPAPGTPSKTAIMPILPEQETLQPAQLAAQLDQRKDEVLRFGRGVASLPPPRVQETSFAWDNSYARPKPPNRWRARIFAILSTLTTLVLLALVGWWIIQRLTPLEISSATVALAEDLGNRCDVEARVVGTIVTNGAGGTITYRWLTSDGKTTNVLSEHVNLGTDTVQVPLLWRFSGKSTVQAKATLQILSPQQIEASQEFTYSCT